MTAYRTFAYFPYKSPYPTRKQEEFPMKHTGKYQKNGRRRFLWILPAVLAVFFLGAFLWRSARAGSARQEYTDLARTVRESEGTPASASAPEGSTAPAEETEPQILPQYAALYQENPDLFGWLRVAGTVMDYPVMYTPEEPEKYLRRDFSGNSSTGGTLFMDGNCTPDGDNFIIYGHNMRDGTMFRELLNYESPDFRQAHPVIRFDTLYEEGEYEVLSAFYDRVYYENETCFKFYKFYKAADGADFDEAVRNYREKSLYDTGVTAVWGDRLITLVTCATNTENGRFVVVARKQG